MLRILLAGLVAAAALPAVDPSDVEHGRAIYRSNCAFCHGMTGLGGRGPNLVSGERKTDAEIKDIVRNGVPGSTMPAFDTMGDEQLNRLIAFLRHLQGTTDTTETVSGDPVKGKTVYERNGCPACHLVANQGAVYGPDLSRIGSSRSVAYLKESILEPSADIPADFEGVTVVTGDARRLTGIRINEDTFTVQVRLPSQAVRSFAKERVKEVIYPKESLMPAYKNMPADELENLLAYLKTLKTLPGQGAVRQAEGIR
jgi:putative heme-binding domain-containing protein